MSSVFVGLIAQATQFISKTSFTFWNFLANQDMNWIGPRLWATNVEEVFLAATVFYVLQVWPR